MSEEQKVCHTTDWTTLIVVTITILIIIGCAAESAKSVIDHSIDKWNETTAIEANP
jgi:hypothetical protein